MKAERLADYEDFVNATWSRMVRYAHALTGSRSDAEDAVQAAYAKAFSSWRKVERAAYPEAYVRRIVTNEVASGWRRRWRHTERSTDHLPETPTPGHDDAVVTADALWQALQRVPPRQRAVLVLRYYEDLSEREIAETLGVSAGTVKSHASKALQAMRTSLGESDAIATPFLKGRHS